MPPKKKAATPSAKTKPTDLELLGGEVFAVPLDALGCCTGLVSRPPQSETGLIHVYLKLERGDKPLKLDAIGLPPTWPSAWIGLLTAKSLASGRWPIVGRIKAFDRDAFPVPPVRNEAWSGRGASDNNDLFSIETTLDEPSLTAIENVAATANEATAFPPLNVIIAGSNLEKSLVRFFRNMGFTFHDVPIDGFAVKERDVEKWNKHAQRARAATDPAAFQWLPAGSHTDRNAKAGDWFGFPLPGGGFGAAIMLERPEKHLRVFADSIVMSVRRRWDRWPTLDDVRMLTADDGAMIRQMSLISVRDGRWRGLGAHPAFDAADWPWPEPWYVEPAEWTAGGKQLCTRLQFGAADYRSANIDRKTLALDPDAGHAISVMSGGDGIALDTFRVLENIVVPRGPGAGRETGVVTAQRIAAWKEINAAVRGAKATAKKK